MFKYLRVLISNRKYEKILYGIKIGVDLAVFENHWVHPIQANDTIGMSDGPRVKPADGKIPKKN